MGTGVLPSVARGADRASQWAAVALGLSIPVSTALDGVLLVFIVAGWLASGAWRGKWEAVRGNSVALAALALFALLLLGTLYGERDPGDAAVTLRKYLDLPWIAVFVWVLRDPAMRSRALYALAASLSVVLILSYLIMMNAVPRPDSLTGDSAYPVVVFKGRQTHGPLMAFGAFLYVQLALVAATARTRVLWVALALLALVNGTLLVQGVTGYLVFATLALYLGYLWRGWRGLATALAAGTAVLTALMLLPGPFQSRVTEVGGEIAKWRPGVLDPASSVGTRLELYRVSAELVRERPLAGHGTGSYAKAFASQAPGATDEPVRNPHNEYLHILVQLGLVGLAALLYLFVTHWRLAPRLASPFECRLARGLILMMAVGCLFNSWLMDHTEGLFYAWVTGLLFAGLKSGRTVKESLHN